MSENRKYQVLLDAFPEEEIRENEPMSKHTSFKIGGLADIYITPNTRQSLMKAIKLCRENNIEYYIMGNGSNLLVSDDGYRGAIIQIFRKLNDIRIDGENVYAEAGILLSALSNKVYNSGLKGFEFASGIPGTLGGAVYMNAGAYGGEMKNVIVEVEVMDEKGNITVLSNEALHLGYRQSICQKENYIVISATLKLERGDKEEIKAIIDDLTDRRKSKQPINMPSAGSTFKRPAGYYAGKLIMDSGLMGHSIGGAQVSDKHAGFIINKGGASCSDVLELMEFVRETVYNKYGVTLDPEVKMLGFKRD